jgi:hypothetical protein
MKRAILFGGWKHLGNPRNGGGRCISQTGNVLQ